MTMTPDMATCPHYERGCAAELCPLDPTIDKHVWYVGEQVCPRKEYAKLDWIRTQRKMNRAGISPDYYFTKRMIDAVSRVTKGLKGVSPETPQAEAAWIKSRTGGNNG